MDDLVEEYQVSLKQIRQVIRKVEQHEGKSEEDQVRMSLLRSMERDLLWSIEWMRTGREPIKHRIDRLSRKQREKMMDPYVLEQQIVKWERSANKEQSMDVTKIVDILSPREREIFLMSRVQLISYHEIADLLGIKPTTVANRVERSKKKINHYLKVVKK
jgi:RNA polymerase sigma factor (sigma-70 family)